MIRLFRRVGSAFTRVFFHGVFFVWGCFMRILFPTRLVYEDPSVKPLLRQGVLLIANHQSHMDGFFIPQRLSRSKMYVLVTRKWYDKPKLNFLFRNLRYIPIDLTAPDPTWLTAVEQRLRDGSPVLIFPEGKLQTGDTLAPFHSGFLLPARHLDVPVIPMALDGSYRPFRRQTLRIGVPLALDLHAQGRMSSVLKASTILCEERIAAMAGKHPPVHALPSSDAEQGAAANAVLINTSSQKNDS